MLFESCQRIIFIYLNLIFVSELLKYKIRWRQAQIIKHLKLSRILVERVGYMEVYKLQCTCCCLLVLAKFIL
jgi:hypothetical protein